MGEEETMETRQIQANERYQAHHRKLRYHGYRTKSPDEGKGKQRKANEQQGIKEKIVTKTKAELEDRANTRYGTRSQSGKATDPIKNNDATQSDDSSTDKTIQEIEFEEETST